MYKRIIGSTIIMVLTVSQVLFSFPFNLPEVKEAHALTRTVNNASELQSALNAAQPGDEIVLNNGTYSGQFTINGANGTAAAPITIRAANRHQAILEAPNSGCTWSEGDSGILVHRSYWKIQDIKMRNQVWGIYLSGTGATNVTIQDMIIENSRGPALMLANGANNNLVQNNVIGPGDPSCNGTPQTDGIENWKSANNTFKNNIILPTGANGYACAGVGGCNPAAGGDMSGSGYGMFLTDDDYSGGASTHDNLVQGNLLIGGGRGIFRVMNGVRHTVRDNAFLWSVSGGFTTDHCSDDYNSFINNIGYGSYFLSFATKGNDTGTRGHHIWQHNLIVTNEFSRDGGQFGPNSDTCGGMKFNQTLQDNLLMAEHPLLGDGNKLIGMNNSSLEFPGADHNLFWAPSAPSTWQGGYTYGPNDIHAQASQPQFVNAAAGNFTLATGSPGKNAASDGKDIGIEYNSYLKKQWLQNAFALPTQQKNNLTTGTTFTVDPNHYYQVWFYIPTSFYAGIETFNVEGTSLGRDINGLRKVFQSC